MSGQNKARIRELIEHIDGVTQTWFELEIEGSTRKKTLVVEVGFDLDSNSARYLRTACDDIERTFAAVLREDSGDVVSKLRIVNRSQQTDETETHTTHRKDRGGHDASATQRKSN